MNKCFLPLLFSAATLSAMEQRYNTMQLIPNDYAQTQKKFNISQKVVNQFPAIAGSMAFLSHNIHLPLTTPEVKLLTKLMMVKSKIPTKLLKHLSLFTINAIYFLRYRYYPSPITQLLQESAVKFRHQTWIVEMADIPPVFTCDIQSRFRKVDLNPIPTILTAEQSRAIEVIFTEWLTQEQVEAFNAFLPTDWMATR